MIHRDLKPSNILIDADGDPRILDFGLAKVVDSVGVSTLPISVSGEVMGTPAYMSPEQASGSHRDVDIRSDVYTLGVILFEMLTGQFPYSVTGKPVEVLNNIVGVEPHMPSTFRRAINDEVETIVLQTLAKEADRRYQSAGDLTQDVRHYLAREPIEAKKDSTWYVLKKALRRHKAWACGTAAVLGVSAIWLTYAGFKVRGERDRAMAAEKYAVAQQADAERQTRIAQATLDFLRYDVLAAGDPLNSPSPNITVRNALQAASKNIEGKFPGEPVVESAIRFTLGQVYLDLGEYDEAEPHLLKSVDIRKYELEPNHELTLTALELLANLYVHQSRYDEAEAIYPIILEQFKSRFGEKHPGTWRAAHDYAVCLQDQGKFGEAAALVEGAYERMKNTLGEEHPGTLAAQYQESLLLVKMGKYDQAEPILVEATQLHKQQFDESHPHRLSCMHLLASVYCRQNRYEAAERACAEVYQLRRDRVERV